MKQHITLTAIFLLLAASSLTAATHYVSLESTNPTPPYTNWATAATSIQAAVDVAATNDMVLVTNGAYAGRVWVRRPLKLQSANGPQVTIIDGRRTNQCVSLTDGASLTGFTLTHGRGGVYCASTNAFLTNCVMVDNWFSFGGGAYRGTLYNCTLAGNSGYYQDSGGNLSGGGGGAYESTLHNCALTNNWAEEGAGAYSCTLHNCTLTGNSAYFGGGGTSRSTLYNCALSANYGGSGGGAYGSTLYNCTLTGNSAAGGGGVAGARLYNCIVYFNAASGAANYDADSALNYCCTTPLPTNGVGNIALDPQLASASRLSADSPCRGAAVAAYTSGTDIDGEAWGIPPSIGCDEFHAEGLTGPLAVALTANYTNVAVGYPVSLTALIEGRLTHSVWEFGDGTTATNEPYVVHTWTQPGDYLIALRAFNESHLQGACASVTVHVLAQPVVYVSSTSTNPQPPYISWATAATTIQDAVDAPLLGYSVIIVSNGLYSGDVVVTTPLTLLSANGPEVTAIDGGGTTRCVFLTDGASLSGFTLTNGVCGVYCNSTNAFVTNCLIVGNSGGGAYEGTLYNCTLAGNSAIGFWGIFNMYFPGEGGGAYGSTLYHCTLSSNSADFGGGVRNCTLYNCALSGNRAQAPGGAPLVGSGGGAYGSTLYNCTLTGNAADDLSGGATYCTLYNCTLIGNAGLGATGGALYNCTVTGNAGGVAGAALYNSILYFNGAAGAANYDTNSTLNYCCTMPLPTNGVGNLTNAPLFVDYAAGNLRLQSNSACINAGNNGYLTHYDESWGIWFTNQLELDGNPRVVSGTVDIGAYEYQGTGSRISYAWLQLYGLPTDGSADLIDSDADGENNWQEWVCGTCPTNAGSALRLLSALPTGTNVTLSWQSAAGINYLLERSAKLGVPFALLATNIVGQPGTTSYADTNAAGPGPFFYRLGVMCP